MGIGIGQQQLFFFRVWLGTTIICGFPGLYLVLYFVLVTITGTGYGTGTVFFVSIATICFLHDFFLHDASTEPWYLKKLRFEINKMTSRTSTQLFMVNHGK